ncbi:MAG: energy-coupling factor transporter transmembrane component T [Cellulosilyticaceae bacterium]
MKDRFNECHPIVNFAYFFSVIGFGMFFLHPVYMAISISAAFVYSMMLSGGRALRFNVIYMVPMMLVVACINPMFNHEGATILFYLKNGNPFTLESVVYGMVSSTMLITIIIWFSCYNKVMSSDKLMYLFGKIIPALSLIFAMVLRFVPLYKQRIQIIIEGQKCIGQDVAEGRLIKRIKGGMTVLSIMTTWALENAIETSDSMKARGYGLKNRTAFSNFVFTGRDGIVLGLMLLCSVTVFGASVRGIISVQYFPIIKFSKGEYPHLISYSAYFILCYIPIFMNIMEEIKWKYFISKI